MNERTQAIESGLFQALSLALQTQDGDDVVDALRASFRCAAQALGAERALLLRVASDGSLGELIASVAVQAAQVGVLRAGRTTTQLSAFAVRHVMSTGRPLHIDNTRHADEIGPGDIASAHDWSVLCVPACEPLSRTLSALLYFQSDARTAPFPTSITPHVQAYALGLAHVVRASGRRRGERDNDTAVMASPRLRPGDVDILGHSPAIVGLRERLRRIVLPAMSASAPDPILILGATGTGKEVVASYLHARSSRARGPFVPLNCATFRGDILEAKLFGHVRGAYTGAVSDSDGLFVAADRGVLFLDEVGDMPVEGQGLLLRALETRCVRPVGGRDERPVDVQLICATNVDLERAVRRGRFRADLFHRIKGLLVRLPSLAERRADISVLLAHFLELHERRTGKRTGGLDPKALALLERYHWPGNVRELSSACSSLVMHAEPGTPITLAVLVQALPEIHAAVEQPVVPDVAGMFDRPYASLRDAMLDFERAYLQHVERKSRGNRSIMARRLGLHRKSLWRHLVRVKLVEPEDEDTPIPDDDDPDEGQDPDSES